MKQIHQPEKSLQPTIALSSSFQIHSIIIISRLLPSSSSLPLFNMFLPLYQSYTTLTPQAIQDMNSLKRFVRQAEMSHYALFRCCQFLQGCGNGDVLLQNARAEHSDLPESCSIITVLEEFLKEQSQAQA